MFNLIDIGKSAGSGIPNIYSVWDKQGWEAPIITEDFEPARITFSLSVMTKEKDLSTVPEKLELIKAADKQTPIDKNEKKKLTELQKETIIEFLTDHVSCRSSDIAELLDIKLTRSRDILNALIADGIVVAEGANRNRTYRLKENSK